MSEKMQDALKPQPLKKPLDRLAMGGDVAALNGLLGLLNNPNITGAEVPKGADVLAVAAPKGESTKTIPSDIPAIAEENAKYPGISHGFDSNPLRYATGATLVKDSIPASEVPESSHRRSVVIPQPVPKQSVARAAINPQKIFYTGLIGAGKDYVAEQTGATIFGLPDPIYHLAEYFFGITVNSKTGKDIPGVRQFLQMAGQWGRAEVSEQYPLTPARACFISMIRSLGEMGRFDAKHCIDWSQFGRDTHLWVNGVTLRTATYLQDNPTGKVATPNVRFQPEYKSLSELGWTHFHVMCSAATRAKRVKVTSDKDTSEKMALWLNNDVTTKISQRPTGPKFRVIWNDDTPPPSPRLFTVAEFLREIAINEVPDETSPVMTGE